jgi:hypothetical protein
MTTIFTTTATRTKILNLSGREELWGNEVLTAVVMKISIFWVKIQCSPLKLREEHRLEGVWEQGAEENI